MYNDDNLTEDLEQNQEDYLQNRFGRKKSKTVHMKSEFEKKNELNNPNEQLKITNKFANFKNLLAGRMAKAGPGMFTPGGPRITPKKENNEETKKDKDKINKEQDILEIVRSNTIVIKKKKPKKKVFFKLCNEDNKKENKESIDNKKVNDNKINIKEIIDDKEKGNKGCETDGGENNILSRIDNNIFFKKEIETAVPDNKINDNINTQQISAQKKSNFNTKDSISQDLKDKINDKHNINVYQTKRDSKEPVRLVNNLIIKEENNQEKTEEGTNGIIKLNTSKPLIQSKESEPKNILFYEDGCEEDVKESNTPNITRSQFKKSLTYKESSIAQEEKEKKLDALIESLRSKKPLVQEMIEARKKLEESVKFKLIVDNLDEDIEITSNKNNRVFSSVDKNESKLVNQLNRAKTLSEINNIKVNIFDFKNVEEKLK